MSNDGEVKIKTAIDNSGLQKDAKKTQGIIDGLVKKLSSSKMSNIGASISGIGIAMQAAGKIIQKTKETIDDLTNTYKEQAKAETQLEVAAKNNPYLNESNVRQLKQYASGLQEISTVGDEKLIPLMAQLASSGRTQKEIQEIMSAALDASASGAISLESAVQGLNQSYSGQIGMLGKQLPMLKNLTVEELKQGKAVEAVANAYKGMAKETAEATGTAEQLKNAWGDFKEHIGEGLEKAIAPVRKIFTGILTYINNVISRSKELANAYEDVAKGKKTTATYDVLIEEATQTYNSALQELAAIRKTIADGVADLSTYDELTKAERKVAELNRQLGVLQSNRESLIKQQQAQIDLEKKLADEAERAAKIETQRKSADGYAKESNNALNAKLEAMKIEAEITGKEVDAQEVYNVYLQSYIDLLTKTENTITKGMPVEQKRLEQLEAAKKAAEEAATAEEKLAKATEYTNQVTALIKDAQKAATPAGQLKEQLAEMQKAKEAIQAMSEEEVKNAQKDGGTNYSKDELLKGIAEAEKQITANKVNELVRIEKSGFDKIKEENEKLREMKQALNESEVLSAEEKAEKIREIENSIARNNIDTFAGIMEQVDNYAHQVTSTMQQAADIMLQTVKYQTDAELATLEKKYLQGELSEEEYQEEKIKAKKKAAKEEYKIQLFQWSASILTATADIAAGAAKSLSLGFPVGIIAMALTLAAGAVQIASLIAAKPTPPSFAGGGIVQGNSYTGDKVRANVNSGEMILNATQQKALWEVANGKGTQNGGFNLNITNNASNAVTATPRIDRDKVELLIDMRVNDSLKNGRYDQSLEAAEAGMSGSFYGI